MKNYTIFIGKQEKDKLLHEFEGIVKGILFDNEVLPEEIEVLNKYFANNKDFITQEPFQEIYELLQLSTHNRNKEILESLKNISFESLFYDDSTNNIQVLQGLIKGIIADDKIDEKEIKNLIQWMDLHKELKKIYPYNIIEKLIKSKDIYNKDNQKKLLEEFKKLNSNNSILDENVDIIYKNHNFCISGTSQIPRNEIIEKIENLGGKVFDSITSSVDYLILCEGKSAGWAYGNYGRKVERAIENKIPNNIRKKII